MNGSKYWQRALSLVDGCTPCSPGCEHCWSANMAYRFIRNPDLSDFSNSLTGLTSDGRPIFTGRIKLHLERLDIPMKTRKSTVWQIWNDLFHEDVPDEFIREVHWTMQRCRWHKFLILTKRHERIAQFFADRPDAPILPHVFYGVTVCNQPEADEKIPLLLQVPGHKWLSVEPMLGEIDLHLKWSDRCTHILESCNYFPGVKHSGTYQNKINWVVVGCETGPKRRHCDIEWIRSIVQQCQAGGVQVFVKQIEINGKVEKDIEKFPEDLQVRDLPWKQGVI